MPGRLSRAQDSLRLIGISFYTFEAISYVVDVYQRKIRAEKNLLHFLLFITFFPHLVSGPIVRGRDFLPQIRRPKRWSWPRAHLGVALALGLFKKMAIGDRMALFVEPVFAHPDLYRTSSLWIAMIAFTIQLYCDFSGYTDMALGAAHLLGYKLTANFRMPYLSTNVTELWRRWHISLSNWIRDYLFIPLGGSRGSSWRTCARISVVVMTLGGLWHGANWGFVVWGLLHGFFLVVHRGFQAWCRPRPAVSAWLVTIPGTFLRWLLTVGSFVLALVFFRARTLNEALTVLHGMFLPQGGLNTMMTRQSLIVLTLLVLVGQLLGSVRVWSRLRPHLPTPAIGACYATLVVTALVLAPKVSQAFLYFQF